MMNTAADICITAIILNWNRIDLLKTTVESFLHTVQVPYELIIADNDSGDGSAEYINSVCRDHPHHHALLLNRNYGGEAFNFAMEKARGRYILFSENDLEYLPGWDRALLEKFEIFPGLGQLSVFSPFHEVERGEIWTDKPAIKENRDGHTLFIALTNVGTSSMIRRSIWDQGLRWKAHGTKTYWSPDDGAFSAEIKKLGYQVAWNDRYVVINWGHNVSEMTKRMEYYLNNAAGKAYLGTGRLMEAFREHGYAVDDTGEQLIIKQTVPPERSNAYFRRELWKDWVNVLSLAREELGKAIAGGEQFSLIDEDQFGIEISPGHRVSPFPEANGMYNGAPADSNDAIIELKRQIKNESRFLVIMWPAFWWLDYYHEFSEFLESNFHCMINNERLIVFDLTRPGKGSGVMLHESNTALYGED